MTNFTSSGTNIQNGGGELTVHSGDTVTIVSGGSVSSGLVQSGGILVFDAGTTGTQIAVLGLLNALGAVSHVTVDAGGVLSAYNGGSTLSSVILGTEVVGSGGTDTGSIVSSGGTQDIYGGTVSGTVISSDGEQIVSGGTVSGTTIAGGSQIVFGGTVAGMTLSGGEQLVLSGSVSGAILTDGEQLVSGGTVADTIISSSGRQVVALGTVTGTTINRGGEQIVSGSEMLGGRVSGTTVSSGGTLVVDAGGSATGLSILSGAIAIVSNGTASATTGVVQSGGTAELIGSAATALVFSGGTEALVNRSATGLVLSAGAIAGLELLSGGTASGTVAVFGTTETIGSGGIASGTVLAGGLEIVSSGGSASGTVVSSGGVETVLTGGTAFGTVLEANGTQAVSSGGNAYGTTITSGGAETVLAGATVSGTLLEANGNQTISSGGSASGTMITGGGMELVLAGAIVSGTTVEANATQVISAGAIASDTLLDAGGTVVDDGTLVFDQSDTLLEGGGIIGSGGLDVSGPGTIVLAGTDSYTGGTVIDGGTLVLGSQYAAGTDAIDFAGAATLELDVAGTLRNVISGFGSGDAIDLEALGYDSTDTLTVAGNRVTVSADGEQVVLNIVGASSDTLVLVEDATDGSVMLETCFAAGTLIATPDGQRAVEEIAPGEMMLTADGPRVAIWCGHRTVDLSRLPDPEDRWLVRICADAFADDVPRRDLWVTQEHGILVEGGLVPARMLVNGGSIALDRTRPRYTYHHIELERHAILFAEGLETESYLDTGNRGAFSNAPVPALRPELVVDPMHARWATDAAAPLMVSRDKVEPIWRRLAERSVRLGHRAEVQTERTLDPDLRVVLSDGRVLRADHRAQGRYAFRIPAGARPVQLLSRSTRPSDSIGPFVDDRRRLGVAVERLVLWQGLDDSVILAILIALPGWHAAEGAVRWTDGAAALDLPAAQGVTTLDIHVAAIMSYPLDEAAEVAQDAA